VLTGWVTGAIQHHINWEEWNRIELAQRAQERTLEHIIAHLGAFERETT
jgi:hypothetical protein